MPTWAATNSLLQPMQRVDRTNSEVVAPLFKTPPTDYATLYTVLSLTQEISAVVMGPERSTIITLDLDLYERAIKIQESASCSRWVLRAGELHICFAALHALGKYVEGSGLDTIAIETGIYSPAALRGIYAGKAFKRGVEYHVMNVLACFFLLFDAVLLEMPADAPLRKKCEELKCNLHDRNECTIDSYNDLASDYANQVQPLISSMDAGELAQFLINYIKQVQCLLHIISACRQGDWEGYLAALDNQIQYFFAHDLHHYARLMPVHIAQMNKLEMDDPKTWEALKEGNFIVKKSTVPFTALFADQALEQKIKELKGMGSIVGITHDKVSLDRIITTLPHITSIIRDWLDGFPRLSTTSKAAEKHYQLSGDIAQRSTRNALKLKESIQRHCEGNPFIVRTPLKSIVSSVMIPDAAKVDILNRDKKGMNGYQNFVHERLLQNSPMSVWDPMKKMKLKTFCTWMAKTRVTLGDKVIKLREERQLLARFLIIQQSRPKLVPQLSETIGNFEMAITPRSMFALDGSLLIPTDKSSIIHVIEEAIPIPTEIDTSCRAAVQEPKVTLTPTPSEATTPGDTHNLLPDIPDDSFAELRDHVIIIDGMAVVQSMKKSPDMKIFLNFKNAFVRRITRMVKAYDEAHIIFDRYDITHSLKRKTRAKRAQGNEMEFAVHDEMAIAKVTLKELLSAPKTKALLSNILGDAILNVFKESNMKVVVVKSTTVQVNYPHSLTDVMSTHNHEEADTLIPLHVLHAIGTSTVRNIDVWSPDTDVLILLLDLVANGRLGTFTKLQLLTGKGKNHRSINIPERVRAIGQEKCRGLIGLHNFTGADWGGKFVGISKKTWITSYLNLPDNDPIISVFQLLGNGVLANHELMDGELPEEVQPLERFICSVYSPLGPTTIPALRWELFRSRNLEGEKLPPTRGTLMPHIIRTNFVAMRDKSYTTPHPCLPPLEENGWIFVGEEYVPVRCLYKPAPSAAIELVKCGCRTSCKSHCSCQKNSLSCTALCKCYSNDCSNFHEGKMIDEEDSGA